VTDQQIKHRAQELATAKLGEGAVTRIGASMVAICNAAQRTAVDRAILLAIAQHKMSNKTLVAATCEPIAPALRRNSR